MTNRPKCCTEFSWSPGQRRFYYVATGFGILFLVAGIACILLGWSQHHNAIIVSGFVGCCLGLGEMLLMAWLTEYKVMKPLNWFRTVDGVLHSHRAMPVQVADEWFCETIDAEGKIVRQTVAGPILSIGDHPAYTMSPYIFYTSQLWDHGWTIRGRSDSHGWNVITVVDATGMPLTAHVEFALSVISRFRSVNAFYEREDHLGNFLGAAVLQAIETASMTKGGDYTHKSAAAMMRRELQAGLEELTRLYGIEQMEAFQNIWRNLNTRRRAVAESRKQQTILSDATAPVEKAGDLQKQEVAAQ